MSSAATTLRVRHVDLSYAARVEPPAFDLGARWVELQSAIYSSFAPLGVKLSDIKHESGAGPADLALACWILDHGAVVRFRLDKVEVWSNSASFAAEAVQVSDVVERAIAVLHAASPEARVVSHALTLALHAAVDGASPPSVADYITRTPAGSPEMIPNGVSFLCQLASGSGTGLVVFERSGLVADGAFLRISSEQVGSVSVRDAFDSATGFLQAAVQRLGFALAWEA